MSDRVAESVQITEHREDAGASSAWDLLLDRARQAVSDGNDAALIALDEELSALANQPRSETRRVMPQVLLYRSLIVWKRDREFVGPFKDAQIGKIQIWELDEFCPDMEYRRLFADYAVERFPNRRGFRLFQRILSIVDKSGSHFKVDGTDIQIHRRPGATMTIIGFGAMKGGFAGIGWGLFERAVVAPLNANLIMLQDFNKRIYLAGIESLGDYRTSVAKFREIAAEFADTRIVATGASAGVFGAISFAADIGVRHVVAFAGPTSIEIGEDNTDRQIYRLISADIEAGRFERIDLADKVNNSAIERIDFFVAGKQKFDMEQFHALKSRCSRVHPRIYKDISEHVVTDLAIEDGSIYEAFNAGPAINGLA